MRRLAPIALLARIAGAQQAAPRAFSPRDSIVARPVMVYFSWDPDAHAARWNRIGAARD